MKNIFILEEIAASENQADSSLVENRNFLRLLKNKTK
jgi:hypothetical protein